MAGGPAYSWSPPRQLRRRPPLRRLPHQLGPAPADLSVEAARMRRPARIAAPRDLPSLGIAVLTNMLDP